MRLLTRIVVGVLTGGLSLVPAGLPAGAGPGPDRLAGADAVGLAVSASQRGWPAGSRRVVIASATSWPDTLAAAGLGAPVLLTDPAHLAPGTRAEIHRLGATEAVVVGGEAAVGPAVRGQLRSDGIRLVEAGGADRYETAARVAALLPDATDVVVVSGEAWPDAASIAAWAQARRVPILLTRRDSLPGASSRARTASRVIVVGGAAVVSDAVVASLPNPVRLAGADRYATSAAVAHWTVGNGLTPAHPVMAPGTWAPGALIGGTLAGRLGSPVLLAAGSLPLPAQAFLVRASSQVGALTAAGPPEVVGDLALAQAAASVRSADLLRWVNEARTAAGVAPLGIDARQVEVALARSQANLSQRRLAHSSPSCPTWGEAVGDGTGERAVFDAWMQSPPHRQVVMFASARVAGTAVLADDSGRPWMTLVVCG